MTLPFASMAVTVTLKGSVTPLTCCTLVGEVVTPKWSKDLETVMLPVPVWAVGVPLSEAVSVTFPVFWLFARALVRVTGVVWVQTPLLNVAQVVVDSVPLIGATVTLVEL